MTEMGEIRKQFQPETASTALPEMRIVQGEKELKLGSHRAVKITPPPETAGKVEQASSKVAKDVPKQEKPHRCSGRFSISLPEPVRRILGDPDINQLLDHPEIPKSHQTTVSLDKCMNIVYGSKKVKLREEVRNELAVLKKKSIDELRSAHPAYFQKDVPRESYTINSQAIYQRSDAPDEKLQKMGNELRNCLKLELARLGRDFGPETLEILRYQIEILADQKGFMMEPSILTDLTVRYMDLNVRVPPCSDAQKPHLERAGKAHNYDIAVRNGQVVISGTRYYYVEKSVEQTVGGAQTSRNKALGYDALRFEILIDLNQLEAKDLLLAENKDLASVMLRSHGFRPTLKQLS